MSSDSNRAPWNHPLLQSVASLVGKTPLAPAVPLPSGRKAERVQNLWVEVRLIDIDTGELALGHIVNESTTGAYIQTDANFPLLSKLRLEAQGKVRIAQVVRVHWLSPAERGSRQGGIAVRYLDPVREAMPAQADSIALSA